MAVQLVLMVICGVIGAMIASHKGRSAFGWFFGGFFLGIIGVIIVAVLPNLKQQRESQARAAQESRRLREQLKQERVKFEAFRRHAAYRLDAHDEAIGVDTRSGQVLPAARPAARLAEGAPALQQRPPAPGRLWYYEVNGETRGPVPEAEIRHLLEARQVGANTLVWCEDLGEWTPLGKIRFFGSASSS